MERSKIDVLGPFSTAQWDEGIVLYYRDKMLDNLGQIVDTPHFFLTRWAAMSVALDLKKLPPEYKRTEEKIEFDLRGAL